MTTTYLQKREAIIPTGSLKIQDKQSSAVVYLFKRYDRFCAMAFDGRKFKPVFKFGFFSEKAREQRVTQYFERVRRNEGFTKAHKAKKAAPHNLELGHVFYTMWGYEQTNINFYQVIEIKGAKTVVLRELKQIRNATGDMQGTCAPALDDFCDDSKPIMRRVGADKQVKISDCQFGRLWDGKPMNWTAYH